MWLPVAGLFIGLFVGYLFYAPFEEIYTGYLAVFLLVSLDTLLGGLRAYLQKMFDDRIFFSGFVINLIFACGIAFLGLQLGVDLYLAAVFALGVRLFQNVSAIRREVLKLRDQGKVHHDRE